ncbi:hypothetical protein GWO59_006900 [Corynebacterium macginleyi]|nr:hypothetical protein [Corynebacterium macginleyi]
MEVKIGGKVKRFRKLAAATAFITALAGTSTGATAAVPGNTVLVGDSIVANPTVADYVLNKAHKKANTGVGCVTDNAIANEMSHVSGAHVDQYQCPGASFATGGIHVDDSLRKAAADGNLNHQTKNVVIVAGANDTYPYKADIAASDRAIRGGLRSALNIAHQHAPNAKVIVASYPQVARGNTTCLTSSMIPLPIAAVSDTEQRLRNTLREVSEQDGATFLDAHPMSDGHDMCSPHRWWVNLVDPLPPAPGNLPLHLNAHGTAAYGQFIGHALRK